MVSILSKVSNSYPQYQILGCDLNYHDCKGSWKHQSTIHGHCLTFNPSMDPVINRTFGKRPRLSITFVQNESDSTFGWNGVLQGFNVHYRYPTERHFLPGHSLFLSSKLVSNNSCLLSEGVKFIFKFKFRHPSYPSKMWKKRISERLIHLVGKPSREMLHRCTTKRCAFMG